jgi:hypothetical protein
MKIVVALIVPLLFISSFGANAASFAEVGIELQKRANNFNAHPLREYLVPEGHLVLLSVFSNIKGTCFEENNKSPTCANGRIRAANILLDNGFISVTPNDFNSLELKSLAQEIIKFSAAKRKAYIRGASQAKSKPEKFGFERKKREFSAASSKTLDHFNNSRKKSNTSSKFEQTKPSKNSLDTMRAADKERAYVNEIPSILVK